MLVYSDHTYHSEIGIADVYPRIPWRTLPFVRHGLAVDHGHPGNKLGPMALPIPFSVVLAHTTLRSMAWPARRLHRCMYLLTRDYRSPVDQSEDTLIDPLSFKVGNPLIERPKSFVWPQDHKLLDVRAILAEAEKTWTRHLALAVVEADRDEREYWDGTSVIF